MAKGDADIEMNFKVGNASAASAVVRAVYQNQLSMMKQTQKQSDLLGTSFNKLGRSVFYGLASYAGVSSINTIFSSLNQGASDFIAKRTELEKAITPLLSLEDNTKRMGSIRTEVVQTSIAMGRSLQEVGQFYSDLVGSTGNLSSSQRDQLVKETKELAKLTGGDLVDAQNLLTKSYQIYGKELVNVNQLQNKLLLTQDEGSIEFADMAQRLPELLQTGKFANMSIDDVLGTVIGATRKSGSIEKTMTGLRNMFLIMEEAPEKGVKITGTYLQKLKQLEQLFITNKPKMQELFGKEVVIHASSVTDAFNDVSEAIKKVADVSGDADRVATKLMEKYQDPTFFHTEKMAAIEATIQNAPNLYQGDGGWFMKMLIQAKYGEANASNGTGGLMGPGLTKTAGTFGGMLFPGYAEEGRQITMSEVDDPLFIAMKREEFFQEQEKRQKRLDYFASTPGVLQVPQLRAERDRLLNAPGMQPFLMTPEERKTGVPVDSGMNVDQLIQALDANTKATLENSANSGGRAKPGGAKTNYEETL